MHSENSETPGQNRSQSLRNQIYEILSEKLHRGELLPGSVIDQKKICKELGISRTPLNNALIRLDAEGIVTIHPRSRVTVNILEEEDIQYLYGIIGTIESTLVANGFDNYTTEVLDQMSELNKQMKEYVREGDLRSYSLLHYEFHQFFIMMAPNMFAERILRPIKNRLWDFPAKSFPQQWYLDACAEHDRILEAIRDKDLEEAVFCMKDVHWDFEYNKKYIRAVYFSQNNRP
ncbi:GntR family transcriptional regulator [Desulforhopalus singaporensis]|uniref:DNA-binding transcriptional regulator, GntR family n=1 Tax=Desulforhopalus singaporensis TaxID=91360 RepID=A0A1H0JKN3_9BACT|nr:GntR family transcriptional regulator [Desulforhopalus singaporensis]SDO44338.1 DNA-binding transcriptional regulator, GntR family [Desulforhopalus singaporensis]